MSSCSPDRVAAFAAFFRAHFTYVHQNLRRLGVPAAAVEDAAQEVFLTVLRRADAPITSVRGWLFGIVRRIAWRYRRGASRRDRLVQALSHEPPGRPDDHARLLEREAAELLDRFLARLDDDKRAVFVLAELEQQTAGEIASALGIKENTVYSRLRAARLEFDRSCARLRLGEQRSQEREALLARARGAHAPSPASRERVLACLVGPGLWVLSGEASAAPATAAGTGAIAAGPLLSAVGAVLLAFVAGVLVRGEAGVETGPAAGMDVLGDRSQRGEVEDVPADMSERRDDEDGPGDRAGSPGLGACDGEASPRAGGCGASNDEHVLGDRCAGAGGQLADAGSAVRGCAGIGAESASAGEANEPVGGAGREPREPVRAGEFAPGVQEQRGRGEAGEPVRGDRFDEAPGRGRRSRAAEAESAPPLQALSAGSRDALAREAELIAQARKAIRAGAWAQALALLEVHGREFPDGVLRDERRLSQIFATCSSGQVEAGRAEIERIVHERPGSALARKAAALCLAGGDELPTSAAGSGD